MKIFGRFINSGYVCAVLAALAVLACHFELRAQESSGVRWLVLKNGQSLEGHVSFAEGRYTVEASSGSRIIVAAEKASFIADSVTDIYWDRWSRVDPQDAASHVGLFRWCLKHGLLAEAQKQIDLVAKIPSLENQADHLSRMAEELELVVDRQRKDTLLARQQEIEALQIRALPTLPEKAAAKLASAPTIPNAPIDAEGRPIRQRPNKLNTPQRDGQVELVAFEEEVPTPIRRNQPAWVSNQRLDRETKAYPKGTVSFYKKHLEQKLVANCIQCHDSRSTRMPLVKRSVGQTIPRRMSQQNLHFVMEQVDRKKPLESPLIRMAVTAHGDQKMAAFEESDPYIFDLRKWTIAVSDDPTIWLMQLADQSKAANQNAPNEPVEFPDIESIDEFIADEEVQGEMDPYDPAAFNKK